MFEERRIFNFLKKIWSTQVLFMGPLIGLFWTSGDICGFQSRQPHLCLVEVYLLHIP